MLKLILDLESGGLPILIEYWRQPESPGELQREWGALTEWQQLGGVFVPVRWEGFASFETAMTMTLHWAEVNTAISDSEVRIAAMNLPRDTLVWDVRLGEPVLREKVGAAPVPRRPAPELGLGPASPLRTWLLIANAVLLVAIALAAVFYRKRPVRSSDR